MTTDARMAVTRKGLKFGIVDAAVIRAPGLTAQSKLAYAVLTTYADGDRESYPARSTIAQAMGCSTDTLDRALKALVAAGWLTVQERRGPDGEQRSSVYALNDLERTDLHACGSPLGTHAAPPAAPVQTPPAAPMRPITTPRLNNTTVNSTREQLHAHPSGEPMDLFSEPLTLIQGQQQPGRDAAWEAWWAIYPRKVGKSKAMRAYRAAIRKGASPAFLQDAVQAYAFSSDKSVVPHPSTWLNDSRWDDPADEQPGNMNAGTKLLPANDAHWNTGGEF